MSTRIILETHEGTESPWYSVDLVAGNDRVSLAACIGQRWYAEDLAKRWADHLALEIEERDWSAPV